MELQEAANGELYYTDNLGDKIFAWGTTVPTDATDGYAKGCIFTDTDVATGTVSVYVNQGTKDSCSFKLINVDTTVTNEIADDAVTNAKIADDAVSLEHLDAGITPSHIPVLAGNVTWSGGGATLASTITGVLATDIVIAQFKTKGTQGTIVQGAVPTTDTITFALDAANTSNDAIIAYLVLRAAA